MCGFAGVFEYGTAEGAVSHEVVVRMRETLAHRGPDGEGIFLSGDRRVGLGHRRLAVVDVAGGAQPMFGRDGECLVYNGEIYNYRRLRRSLESEGVRFQTNCDTEVVLHLYQRDGTECLRSLVGMFAFALWDSKRERLFLARDRIGEKPIYICDRAGRVVFGSEIKALLEHPAVHPELDVDALEAYLTHLVTPSPFTLFRGISKLAQGQMAVCDADGVRVSRYWDTFTPRGWRDVSLADAAATVREHLERSVDDRLMSDVPVGVLLSGGLDSTTLVALLRERAQGLATFSVGFEGQPAFDERDEARRVARHYGTSHHEVSVSEAEAISFLPRLIRHTDEPLADPVGLALHFMCALAARSGVKVVLGGEGADELFWGSPRYPKIVRWWRALRHLRRSPQALRRAGARTISPHRHARLREFADGIAADRIPPMHMPAGVPRHQRAQLTGAGANNVGWRASEEPLPSSNPFDTLAFDTQEYEFGVRLPERLLMRLDRLSMANGVEARVPFLDHELVEFVYRLPPAFKLRGAETKLVLRRAVGELVPAWVLARRKQGFEAPVADWFGSKFGGLLGSLVSEDAIRSVFDPAGVEALLRPRRSGAGAVALWPVLNFALWHMEWIEGRDLDSLLERALSRAPQSAHLAR